MIYLDNSATTKIHPEVCSAMLPYLEAEYGNPSSKYYLLAANAKKSVDQARSHVGSLLGIQPEEVVFTSGATESNNMILKGIADYYENKGKHIVTTKVEHASTMETCNYLAKKGFKITFLDVDRFGRLDLEQFESVLQTAKPLIVSIIWGNNELGSLNPIPDLAERCLKNDVFLHVDATQVVGKLPIHLSDFPGVRFLSCSAHKIHGPKGIGAAVLRKHPLGYKTKITPLLHGGGQEFEYRSGTLAVHNIVGFGKAAEIALRDISENTSRLLQLEMELKALLLDVFGDQLVFNSDNLDKIPGVLSIRLKDINNELFLKKIAPYAALSSGSACSSDKPSHVLQAAGYTLADIRSTVRFSLSTFVESKDLQELKEGLMTVY